MHTAAASAEIEASLKASAPGPLSPAQPVINYCPNQLSWVGSKQIVKLTFAQWRYRATHEVTVDGFWLGLEAVEKALEILHQALPSDHIGKELLLIEPAKNEGGKHELFVCDDALLGGYEWLKQLLIAYEITELVVPPNPDRHEH